MKRDRRASKEGPGKPGRAKTGSQPLSVGAMVGDAITGLSLEHWADGAAAAVSPELVKRLYDEVLCGESVARIQLLETSKYLEK